VQNQIDTEIFSPEKSDKFAGMGVNEMKPERQFLLKKATFSALIPPTNFET
jgi:hypothetical protein